MKSNSSAFGVRLRSSAKKAGYDGPTVLARAADLHPVTVSAYFRGTRSASLASCFQMAKVLSVDPHWLHTGSVDSPDYSRLRLVKDSAQTNTPSSASFPANELAELRAHVRRMSEILSGL